MLGGGDIGVAQVCVLSRSSDHAAFLEPAAIVSMEHHT